MTRCLSILFAIFLSGLLSANLSFATTSSRGAKSACTGFSGTGLLAHNNPVNGIDPSGKASTLTEVSAANAIGLILISAVILQTFDAIEHATWTTESSSYSQEMAATMASASSADLVRPKSKQEFRRRVREKTKKDRGSHIFMHGTSTGAFADYASGKVNFDFGRGDLGRGFYTTRAPDGVIAAGGYAYQRQAENGGIPIVLLFAIKHSDFATMRGKYMMPNPSAHSAVYPGYDYVEGPLGGVTQFKWQPGKGSARFLKGFRGFVPLPDMTSQVWGNENTP